MPRILIVLALLAAAGGGPPGTADVDRLLTELETLPYIDHDSVEMEMIERLAPVVDGESTKRLLRVYARALRWLPPDARYDTRYVRRLRGLRDPTALPWLRYMQESRPAGAAYQPGYHLLVQSIEIAAPTPADSRRPSSTEGLEEWTRDVYRRAVADATVLETTAEAEAWLARPALPDPVVTYTEPSERERRPCRGREYEGSCRIAEVRWPGTDRVERWQHLPDITMFPPFREGGWYRVGKPVRWWRR